MNGLVATSTYDDKGQLTLLAHEKGGATQAAFGYTYNSVGNRTSKVVNMQSVVRTETYSYDAVDQVTGVDYGNARTEGFVYDAVGNRQTLTDSAQPAAVNYSVNAKNQYTTVGPDILSYDSKGNLAAVGTAWAYTYDSKNRLLSAVSSGLGVNLAMTYDFGPAPLRCAGRRSARKRDTSLRAKRCQNRVVSRTLNGATRYFIYDGWSLIAEYNSTGDLVQKYVHGGVIDEILVKTQGTTDAFYHHDALGSTVLLTNASSHVVRSYEYDAFGKVQNPPVVDGMFSADPHANRFLYTGRELLQEVGLYDYRNRVYSAELGRFLQSDPIRFDAGDVNIYRYVGNNPVNAVDPNGQAGVLLALAPGLQGAARGAVTGAATGAVAGSVFGGSPTFGGVVADGFKGAVSGAVGGAVGGFVSGYGDIGVPGASTAGSALGAATGTAVGGLLDGSDPCPKDYGVSLTIGVAAGLAGEFLPLIDSNLTGAAAGLAGGLTQGLGDAAKSSEGKTLHDKYLNDLGIDP